MKIKAVIFDLDGVLTETSEFHYMAWKQLADEIGVSFDRAKNEKLRGVPRRKSLEILLDGKKASEEQMISWMEQKNSYYVRLLESLTPGNILPGALSMLKQLKGLNIKTGIASASKNAPAIIKKLGLDKYIDTLSDGNSVKNQKPAPDIFLHCAENLGVSAEEAVVVEDAEAGVEAALAGGFKAVGLGPKERVGKAHRVFASLKGLVANDLLF